MPARVFGPEAESMEKLANFRRSLKPSENAAQSRVDPGNRGELIGIQRANLARLVFEHESEVGKPALLLVGQHPLDRGPELARVERAIDNRPTPDLEGGRRFVGIIPLLTGLLGDCPLYTVLGFSTCPRTNLKTNPTRN